MYASVTTVRGAGPEVGVTAKMAADSMLSWLNQFEGYCGLLIFASPETGSARIMTLWENEEALNRSERSRAQVRESMIATAGAQLESVERYEVVLDERVDSGALLRRRLAHVDRARHDLRGRSRAHGRGRSHLP